MNTGVKATLTTNIKKPKAVQFNIDTNGKSEKPHHSLTPPPPSPPSILNGNTKN